MALLLLFGGFGLLLAAVAFIAVAILLVDPIPLLASTVAAAGFCAVWWWALKGFMGPGDVPEPYYGEEPEEDLRPSSLD